MGSNRNDDLLRVAKCGRVVGLKGEIALWPISNVPQRFDIGSELILDDDRVLTIDNVRNKKDHFIVRFAGLDARTDVEKLVNKLLFGRKLEESALQEGEFFVHDCLSKIVIDSNGESRGVVQRFIPNASSDLLELEFGVLLPFKFISRIDEDTIYLDEPEGLFDIEDKDYR